MEQDQEAFALQYHDCTKVNGKSSIFFLQLLPILNCFFSFIATICKSTEHTVARNHPETPETKRNDGTSAQH